MKVYLSKINESWIIDRVRAEWYQYNRAISTDSIDEADIIWIISPWLWKKEKKKALRNKHVVCSIYHFEDSDFKDSGLRDFKKRDKYVDTYHVISRKTLKELERLTNKKIIYIPFWVNQNIWFPIEDKDYLRSKYNIPNNSYVVGSFQRDTEGKDLISPKLIKGPDQFLKIATQLNQIHENLIVLLAGKRRQFVISELEKLGISYVYREMVDDSVLNELYNCLDLYVVASRKEGGPQAIVECGISKSPIISTDVGFASEILSKNSIFNMENFLNATPDVEVAYNNSIKLSIPNGFEKYEKMFREAILK